MPTKRGSVRRSLMAALCCVALAAPAAAGEWPEDVLRPMVRTASERPLRVYHDWGLYGLASTREARDLRAANRRFNELLRSKGYQPKGGEARDGDGWASWRNRTDQLFAALFPPAE